MKDRNFIEFDLAFLFKKTLFVLELKDNLFWDIRDLPDILFMRRRHYERKLEKEIEYLKMDYIKTNLNKNGINYHEVKGILIDNCHINHEDFMNHKGLINYLNRFNYESETGKDGRFLLPIFGIKYPK